MRDLETTLGGDREQFPETVWSSLLGTEGPLTPAREAALNQLVTLYWRPVYKYVRTAGGATIEDAKDLTQEFFRRLLAKDYVVGADPGKGKFRSFLQMALSRFLSDERDRAMAQKRGGGKPTVSIDEYDAEERASIGASNGLTAEQIYERRWASTVLERALNLLKEEYQKAGNATLFDSLKQLLPGEPDAPPQKEVAVQLAMTENAVRQACGS